MDCDDSAAPETLTVEREPLWFELMRGKGYIARGDSGSGRVPVAAEVLCWVY